MAHLDSGELITGLNDLRKLYSLQRPMDRNADRRVTEVVGAGEVIAALGSCETGVLVESSVNPRHRDLALSHVGCKAIPGVSIVEGYRVEPARALIGIGDRLPEVTM